MLGARTEHSRNRVPASPIALDDKQGDPEEQRPLEVPRCTRGRSRVEEGETAEGTASRKAVGASEGRGHEALGRLVARADRWLAECEVQTRLRDADLARDNYRTLYLQTRGALHRQLVERLRTKRRMRRGKRSSTDGQRRGQIIDAVSIRERPAEITARTKPGHWEGDLITGSRNSHVATLVERYSRYLLLVRVTGKDSATVVRALSRKVKGLPEGLFLSLTWDRGTELAKHKLFTRQTGVPVYFCDPKSPWQRGTNENTNGLVRQYFPKGLDLSAFSQRELDVIAVRLNGRPRKILGFDSPRTRITGGVARTG